MRYGTFLCWLFGHKFIGEGKGEKVEGLSFGLFYPAIKTNYCIRCGIDKGENNGGK